MDDDVPLLKSESFPSLTDTDITMAVRELYVYWGRTLFIVNF